MMQNWNSGVEVFGSQSPSFYGAQDSYYYLNKEQPGYGGYQATQNPVYSHQQLQSPYNVSPPGTPAVSNTGYSCQQPTPYQPYMQEHVSPPVAPLSMAPAYMEQPYPLPNYPPCQGPPGGPWNYGYCYGFYGEAPCPYVDVIDMEDFMNNEKRKEKSRDAARCRRSRETEIFQDLASLLPMRQEDVDHLDKASVMRLSIAYLRVREMLELFPNSNAPKSENTGDSVEDDITESEDVKETKLALEELAIENEKIALQTLDGFLLILSADGDVTYVSENVSEYLGISQIDVMGQPIWDYSHQCDHEELREALNGRHSPAEINKGVTNGECAPLQSRDFFLRLKCTLTSRGRSVNIKSASYKVIHITGHIACKENGQRQLVAVARPLPHPSNIEIPLDSSTFLSKHSLDMKFSYVDDKMHPLLGYSPADLMGKPLYECHHGIDSEHLMGTFKNVISKGQSETARYRFLASTGGYAWVVTQATLIYDKQKPHSIVCVNHVISGVENKDEIYSCAQLEARQQKSTTESPPVASQADATAVTKNNTVKTSDKVLKENINHSNTDNRIESEPLLSEAIAKKKPLSAEQVIRVLGTTTSNSSNIVRKVTAAPGNSVPRPVSVTASIFTSAPKKEPLGCNESTVGGVDRLPPVRKVVPPQSVTAKLFVTFSPPPPPVAGAGAASTSTAAAANNANKPKYATDKIFAPRTQDMNKGFLMFSEEEPGLTMLKDEPDDLTHLAPTAGDACIPLEETGPFFNDIFDDFMIPDSYRSLLQEELSSLDSVEHRLGSTGSSISVPSVVSPLTLNGTNITMVNNHHNSNTASSPLSSHSSISIATSPSPSSLSSSSSLSTSSTASSPLNMSAGSPSGTSGIGTGPSSQNSSIGQNCHSVDASSNDPFINYRDEICENSHSPHLLSPGLSKSPEGSSIPSLCSPNGSGCPEDELAFMTLNMDDDLDLSMRAPYISMSEVDDLPLLTSDDLMWGAPPPSVDGGIGASKYLIKQEFLAALQQQENATVGKSVGPVGRTDLSSNSSPSSLNNNNENNCNIGNKIIDSSLAALLCGNVINIHTATIQPNNNSAQILIRQQQPQVMPVEVPSQQQPRETVGEKKIKLIESNMVHPMVVISPGFKSNNTIETWTMNDLLQLNGGTNGNGPAGINATSTPVSKLNGTVLASIVSKKNSTNSNNTSTTNKRSLATSESGTDTTSKRVKSTTSVSTIQQQQSPTSSPQLLQQLMAPSPTPAKLKSKSKTGLDQSEHRWPTGKLNGLQEQSSNSVLMNLLVSGCDNNIPQSPPEFLIDQDESSQLSMTQDENQLSDDDENCIPILANPMMGSGTPLTIQTDDIRLSRKHGGCLDVDDDFMMTVSPNLLTPSDLELWRSIQQGLDPKKIPTNYGLSPAGSVASRMSKSMATTPTAQLGMLHDDDCGTAGNLLTVLDPAMAISRLRTELEDDEQDFEMTIPVNAILQNNLI
ncbi:protein similar [Topomyia yanbarensis]|uniref:protein similar n=1 Tax=Topomyia yanbarensis TaxID=2498891 RepID=UPI00273CD47C|nr:protein similar [Topomyia yanbarensis]